MTKVLEEFEAVDFTPRPRRTAEEVAADKAQRAAERAARPVRPTRVPTEPPIPRHPRVVRVKVDYSTVCEMCELKTATTEWDEAAHGLSASACEARVAAGLRMKWRMCEKCTTQRELSFKQLALTPHGINITTSKPEVNYAGAEVMTLPEEYVVRDVTDLRDEPELERLLTNAEVLQ